MNPESGRIAGPQASRRPKGRAVMMPHSRKVVLFLPPYSGKILTAPLGLLSLAGSLRQAGFEPRIIDGALDRDYRRRILEEIEDCLCFGVSLLTGPMILDAIEVSRMVKRARPDLTIIFGGWHPSLESGQTLREDFVDAVVRHQGEATLVEILLRLESGKSLDLVSGCWFKRQGRIIQNPDRPAVPISELPAPAYDLIDFDAYERATGVPSENCPTRRVSAAPTPATTARTWSFTTGASMPTTPHAWLAEHDRTGIPVPPNGYFSLRFQFPRRRASRRSRSP